MVKAHKKREASKGGPSASNGDYEVPRMDIKSILNEINYLGSTHMTWKQKKVLENQRVVSLGGKPPKKQRLPLSVARPMMKNQKKREEKLLQENAEIARFGGYSSRSSIKVAEKSRSDDKVKKSIDGNFRNGVLDVKHLLQPSAPPRLSNDNERLPSTRRKKSKGGKDHGKKKGNGRKRH